MTSLKIQRLDQIDHILKRPDMYVGSIRNKKSLEYVAFQDGENYKIEKREITFPPALLRIFVEALSNAIDNAQRSKEAGVPCSKIKVTLNKETGLTSVWNDGFTIPIEKHEDGSEYKHTLIFGELRTSTNFDDSEERVVSGRNGLGVKLLNVFSKNFKIKGVDNGKMFAQEWEQNMRVVKPPKVTSSALKTGFTEVSWIPDFTAFGIDGYTDDIISLYTRYILDAAMLTKLSVYFNDVKVPVKSLQDYSKLFVSPTSESVYIKGKDSEVLLSTADEFEAVSFVNGVFTINGGKHVDRWSEVIFRPIVEHYNKPKKPQITIKDVKQFYRIFVVSTLVNPEFTSQSKTELAAPDVQAEVEKKIINAILKWEHTKKISDIIEGKEMLVMKKSEAKRKTFKAIAGYEPANEAGGKKSRDCTLALCEGLSAKTFAIKGIDCQLFGRSGRDWFGVYALRGKILNVIKSNPKTISENKIITDVIQALGLRYGVDYTDDANFSQLNYGRLLILTDADTDGYHIAGLIMAFFQHLFPSLLKRDPPFLYNMMTPIAKALSKKGDERIFYNMRTADEFYKASVQKVEIKYFKGLGSWTDEGIEDVFGKRVISYNYDGDASKAIVKAFGKDTNERKDWMEKYDPHTISRIDEHEMKQDISSFIDDEFIMFPIDDCKRSIPSIMDGLKQSQRKILYACFLRKLTSLLKVSQLSGYVAEKSNYHHGEQNLYETITKMANEFVNSNNIPLLYRDGQFGSRSEGGKDAANARYIRTRLEEITRYIFPEEDDDLLERVADDGDIVEPVYYVPVIPMVLVNGSDGIGSGWSSTIPNYNPIDVINMVRTWIDNKECYLNPLDGITIDVFEPITPWYRGFKGVIEECGKDRYMTKGISTHSDTGIVVTEIPIGHTIQQLQEQLDKLREEKKIKSYRNYSSANETNYVIQEIPDTFICDVNNLKLYSYISTSNMVLFDSAGKIKKYASVNDIVVEFCLVRLRYYTLRKQKMEDDLRRRLKIANNKYRFISEIMDETLVLKRKKTDAIESELESRGYEKEKDGYGYLLGMQIASFSEEKLNDLKRISEKLEMELAEMPNVTEDKLWLKDLDNLEKKYNEWVAELEATSQKRTSKKKQTATTKKQKK
jgi:DNA topoisomerase-2